MGAMFSELPEWDVSNMRNGAQSTKTRTEYDFRTSKNVPQRVDLRRTTCFPYLPPQDQGFEGSCVSHAMSAAVQCAQRRHNVDALESWAPHVEQHFQMARKTTPAAHRRPTEEGITFTEAAKAFENDGIKTFRLKPNLNNFKQCLYSGYPFVFGFTVTAPMRRWQDSETLQKASEYVLPDYNPDHAIDGFHSVLAVGYDDCFRSGSFIVRNSWGPSWGHNGHFYIPYHTMANKSVVKDAIVVDWENK
jgi:C1A family cysteine protease